jgi:Fe-S-cluster containining protein
MDFSPFFKQYEVLVNTIEDVVTKVKGDHGDCVACKPGCSDCCYAIFDLTLIEAMYIKHKFDELFTGKRRHAIITEANDTDRAIFKMKKNATEAEKVGVEGRKIIERISKEKIKCPLLDDKNQCSLYEFRPIACRVYGIPTSTAGEGHTCGLSGFKQGVAYPTLNMDRVYAQLYSISNGMVRGMNSKYRQMGDILVPLSMCLITDYNEDYLGLPTLNAMGDQNG